MRILLLTLFLLNFNLAFGQNYATLKKTNNSSSADALKRISSTNAYAVDSVGRKNQSEATDSSGMYLHETTTDKIKVFIDCSLCDIKDIKQNVQFVDYVRDRKDADVFVLITTVKNGGGGVEYTFFVAGQHQFSNKNDTLLLKVNSILTDAEIKNKQIKLLKTVLLGYLVRTDSFEDLEIFIDQKKEEPPAAEKQWKNWVFDIGLSGYFSWDQNYKENSTWTNLTVVKTNHQLKTEITLTGEFFGNTYKYDNSVYKTQNKDLSAKGLVVKSISDHWSAGFQSGIVHSTFGNYDLSASIFPSMEYNIFPYSKFTRKQLTVLYGIGYTRNNYIDTTIFNRVHENLYSHKLGLAFKVIDKWGNISLALQGSNYFHNWNYNKLTVSTDTRFRLFKGFYLKMLGGISVIHDQINLSASGIDYEQVLLQQKEILSTYYYWFQVGINFTFGDIYNSVVNPRFTQLF